MKKKIWIASILTALSMAAAVGGVVLSQKDAPTVVTQAAENWQGGELDNKYLYGTTLDVPAASVEVNGVTVAATASVTYPNGLTVTGENVKLNQAGIYTVTYRAVVDGTHCVEQKTFSVEDKAYFVQSEESSVEYGKYTAFGSNTTGLKVRLARGDSLTFSKLMDFDKLKSTDSIFELFVTPNARGIYDFSRLIVMLSDPTDSSKYLRIQLRKYGSDTNGLAVSYVDVGGNGQSQVGCESGQHRVNGWGTPIEHSFSAVKNDPSVNNWSGPAINTVPDAHRCYVTYNSENMEVKASNAHVANLNDLSYYERVWQGFPSGKAKVTITADEYASDTANFCITKIFGMDLSEAAFDEDEAPMIDVALTEEEMPQAQVGYEYTIPAATSFDYYAGNCDVQASVYRDYAGSPISVGVVDGKFKPTIAGWYTIVYTAKDALGNEAKETRNVYVSQDLGSIDVTLPDTKVTSATLGSWVPVGEATYTGDSGFATVKKTVTLGDKTYEITDGFIPEEKGVWTVTYTVSDYIGRVGTASYEVDAQIGEGYVVLDEIVMPKIFVAGSEYTLPVVYANDYSSGKPERILCDVVVTDSNGVKTYKAGDKFVPAVSANGDKVSISYQCNGVATNKQLEIPAVLVRGFGEIVAKNYFYGEGFSTSYKDKAGAWYPGGIEIIADADSERCGWTFATPQLASDFNIEFEGIAGNADFEALVITLTDSINEKEKISITLKVKSVGSTVIVGDTAIDLLGSSLSSGEKYKVFYNDGKFTFDGTNFAVEKTVYGEEFTGFSSNLMYVNVDMVNVIKGASYKVLSISGSNISRRNLDVFIPNFKILGEFGGNQSLDSVFEVQPGLACDVFAPITTLTLTVTGPDGKILTDNNGLKLENVLPDKSYFITLSQYGKYQITYTAKEKDWVTENAIPLVKSIFVIDEIAPQAAFINATQTTAKVGDVITMPELVYQDNITTNEKMVVERGVYSPTGKLYLFKEGENAIKCAYAGKYKFIANVLDEFGNMKSVTHVVTVTQ